jgi:phytoene desaturase
VARVIVIGAGVGGLAVAARLAASGHAVTVCEQADAIGGKLGTLEVDGYRFDTGPSLLTMPHVFADLFADTGAPLDDVLPLERLDPIAHYRFADGAQVDVCADLDATCASLDAGLGPGRGARWRGLQRRAGAMWRAVRGPFLESPLDGALTLARQAVRVRDLVTVAPHRTLRDLGRNLLGAGPGGDARLVMLLDRAATYTGSDPRRAPAALATIPWVEQSYGGWYVPGGLYRLGEATRDRALERGVVVRLGADVAAVDVDRGRVAGVRLTDGEHLPADVVVANTDAAHLYGDLLPADAASAARRRLDRATPSLSGFVLLLGVRSAPGDAGRAHHTVLFPADYDAEFDAIFGADPHPVEDPTIYVAAPPDPAVAPPGHQAWFVLVNAPRSDQVDWDAPGLRDAYADRILDLMAERGLDVRDRVVLREVRTPADLARRTRAVGGAIYGTSSNGPAAAFLRPPNRTAVPGLFLVGGSSHPGGGLPLVALSAAIVARLVGPA